MRFLFRKRWLLLFCSVVGLSWARAPIPGLTPQSRYAVYYGAWSDALVHELTTTQRYDLLIVQPSPTLTRATVAVLQASGTRVLCYLSLGEDSALHARATWYYDADADSAPDRNAAWDSYYVNVADRAWRRALKSYTGTTAQGWYGYDYALRTLGCDGLFLDTIDTVAPAAWSGRYSAQLPDMLALIESIRADIPRTKLLVVNRGLFFLAPFDGSTAPDGLTEVAPSMPQRLRRVIDGLLIESWTHEPQRAAWIARIQAQAAQPDGFSVLTLDYPPTTVQQSCTARRDTPTWLGYLSTPALDAIDPAMRAGCDR